MKWVDSRDLSNWASRRDSEQTLQYVVRKLIRATADGIRKINFPSGDNIYLKGWDGILVADSGTDIIPEGTSVWEFGTSVNPKGKADTDYENRSANALGLDTSQTTFVFVTPRTWANAEDWVNNKNAEGIWKGVKVINGPILEQWIEEAPSVGSWLAKHIGKLPEEGILSTEDFWDEWSTGPKIRLNPEMILGGRAQQAEELADYFTKSVSCAVKAISRDETIAFIISSFKGNIDLEEDFFSRSIIVENAETFRKLAATINPLIIIPRFDDPGIMNIAEKKGHTILVPLDINSPNNWANIIKLPPIDRDAFVSALIKAGLKKEEAERHSRESARNITVLRRQLEFERSLPIWARPENVRYMLPALIVGRWNDATLGDRAVIAEIAGDSYESYIEKLKRWQFSPDSPIIKIGNLWRLTSPLDAWTHASINLAAHDFLRFRKAALNILSEINPTFQLRAEDRYLASFYGKKREYSEAIREGVLHSLILTSIFGDQLSFDLPSNGAQWVDDIIYELLKNDDIELWKSFERLLPLISEASPHSFLYCAEEFIDKPASPITALFDEDPGFMTPKAYYTGLLWALEGLAWHPDFFSRSILLLAKLASVDPGGSLSNRPINSLYEIFKSWHPQTAATLEDRIQVLQTMSKKQPEIAWKILASMLPSGRETASPTHKMRWRSAAIDTERMTIFEKEIYDTVTKVLERLMSDFEMDETRLASLIDLSVDLPFIERERLLKFIQGYIGRVEHRENLLWHAARKILSRHRSYPDAPWSLPEPALEPYQKIYDLLVPESDLDRKTWLFNEHFPLFAEGKIVPGGSWQEEHEEILKRRRHALEEIYNDYGIKKIIEISQTVTEPWIMGETFGYISIGEEEMAELLLSLNDEEDSRFIPPVLFRKSILLGIDWAIDLYQKLANRGFSGIALAKYLAFLKQGMDIWNFIETLEQQIQDLYWKTVKPSFYTNEETIYGLIKLIEYHRYISALNHLSYSQLSEIPSSLLYTLLNDFATVPSEEKGLDYHPVEQIFEELSKREDITKDALIQLEWLYLPIIANRNSHRGTTQLHKELAENPGSFVQVLGWGHKPDSEEKAEAVPDGYTDGMLRERGQRAIDLLQSFKLVPGNVENEEFNFATLQSWVEAVRLGAESSGRIEVADRYIGKILANYPRKQDEDWPPEQICDILESIATEDVLDSFRRATFSKYSSSTRGAFDGGDIERNKAAFFKKIGDRTRNKFPSVAKIFYELEKYFAEDAKRMDNSAERDRLEY